MIDGADDKVVDTRNVVYNNDEIKNVVDHANGYNNYNDIGVDDKNISILQYMIKRSTKCYQGTIR